MKNDDMEERRAISLKLPVTLISVIDDIAKATYSNRTAVIIDAILLYLVQSEQGKEYYLGPQKKD